MDVVLRKVLESDELWEGEMRPVTVDGTKVLILRIDGQVRAFEDRCAHLGIALSEGRFEGGVLVCRAHHYEYDARTGSGVNPRSVCLRAFPTEEKDGAISVEVRP